MLNVSKRSSKLRRRTHAQSPLWLLNMIRGAAYSPAVHATVTSWSTTPAQGAEAHEAMMADRQIARGLGVSHHTVNAQRQGLERTGQIAQLEKTVGADGKARTTTPARRPRTEYVSEAELRGLGVDLQPGKTLSP